MMRVLSTIVLSLLCSPLLAQAARPQAPVPDKLFPAPEVTLDLKVLIQDHIYVKMFSLSGEPFFGFLIASFDGSLLDVEGLPPLLAHGQVVASVYAPDGALFLDLGPTPKLGLGIYVQGVGLANSGVLASAIQKIVL